MRKIIFIFAAAAVFGIFYWSLFAPKEDISQRIYRTLKEQESRADLSFNKVSFEEVFAGEKFWQLNAESAVVNKSTGIATLKDTEGIFFKKGKAALKFKSPAALWDMKQKEILLDRPVTSGSAYLFKAKNLSWNLSDRQLLSTGGIVLKRGGTDIYAERLRGDVEFRKVNLDGSPRAIISLRDSPPITFEAGSFELDSEEELLLARGNPVVRWNDAKIVADSARYLRTAAKLQFRGNVSIRYRDISAWGNSADYFTKEQKVFISGSARAVQGENRLTGDQAMVSLKESRISLIGKGKVEIP